MVRILSNIDDVTRHLHSINMSGSLSTWNVSHNALEEKCVLFLFVKSIAAFMKFQQEVSW